MAPLEKFRIDLLTEDRLQKAFEKTRDEVEIPGAKLVRVTEEYYDRAAVFMMDTFMKDEPLAKSVRAGDEDGAQVTELWQIVFGSNMSLMLLDDDSGDIIGIRATSKESVDDQPQFDINMINDTGCKKLLSYVEKYVSPMAKIYDHFGVKELVRFASVGVHPKYRRRGFATQLLNAAFRCVHNLGFESVCIQAEGTSNFTKKIYEANGFEILCESFYDDYKVNGEQVFCNTGEHKSVKVYGKRIN